MILKIIGVKKQEVVESQKEIVSQPEIKPEIEPEAELLVDEAKEEVKPVFFQAIGLLKADSVIFVLYSCR